MFKKSIGYLVLVGAVFVGCGSGGSDGGGDAVVVKPRLQDTSASLDKDVEVLGIEFVNQGGTPTSCTITPSLPSGLKLSSSCTISGTPGTLQEEKTYTVTGSNSAGESNASIDIEVLNLTTKTVELKGTVTYDSVPTSATGLDYAHTIEKKVRGAVVKIIDANGNLLAETVTDANGNYAITVTGTRAKVRVYAKLYKAPSNSQSSWDFKVQDNADGNAQYVIEGELLPLKDKVRDLRANSGWGGSSYSSPRAAAPFAILDVVYQAIDKITTAQSDVVFPPLDIFWSPKNYYDGSIGDVKIGDIGTSHYSASDNAFYILGKEDSDTDEYDTAVVAHEWSHYYEAKFSRSDSIGGNHGLGDISDIRLAFGEGFATAVGCMIIDESLYIDTQSNHQEYADVSDVEDSSSVKANPGWYSEASIYRTLYDIYDSHHDQGDTLSLGFTPIHKVLIDKQKNTPAFTSIFSFITALKAENQGNDTAIDAITSNERIASIVDINGTGRTNRTVNANPLYAYLSVNSSVTINPDYSSDDYQKNSTLGYYNFIRFTISENGTYRLSISSRLSGSNLNFSAFKAGSKGIAISPLNQGASISGTGFLTAGEYRMEIIDYKLIENQQFTVQLTKD